MVNVFRVWLKLPLLFPQADYPGVVIKELLEQVTGRVVLPLTINWTLKLALTQHSEVWFRRRTFHEPNLIHEIKCMKSSASESIRNAYLNLEQLSRSSLLARPGISSLERLCSAFTLGARDFSNAVSGFCQVFIVTRAKRLRDRS